MIIKNKCTFENHLLIPQLQQLQQILLIIPIHLLFLRPDMVTVAQLVRASDCGSEGRGFETPQSPKKPRLIRGFFIIFLKYMLFTLFNFN